MRTCQIQIAASSAVQPPIRAQLLPGCLEISTPLGSAGADSEDKSLELRAVEVVQMLCLQKEAI